MFTTIKSSTGKEIRVNVRESAKLICVVGVLCVLSATSLAILIYLST